MTLFCAVVISLICAVFGIAFQEWAERDPPPYLARLLGLGAFPTLFVVVALLCVVEFPRPSHSLRKFIVDAFDYIVKGKNNP